MALYTSISACVKTLNTQLESATISRCPGGVTVDSRVTAATVSWPGVPGVTRARSSVSTGQAAAVAGSSRLGVPRVTRTRSSVCRGQTATVAGSFHPHSSWWMDKFFFLRGFVGQNGDELRVSSGVLV